MIYLAHKSLSRTTWRPQVDMERQRRAISARAGKQSTRFPILLFYSTYFAHFLSLDETYFILLLFFCFHYIVFFLYIYFPWIDSIPSSEAKRLSFGFRSSSSTEKIRLDCTLSELSLFQKKTYDENSQKLSPWTIFEQIFPINANKFLFLCVFEIFTLTEGKVYPE